MTWNKGEENRLLASTLNMIFVSPPTSLNWEQANKLSKLLHRGKDKTPVTIQVKNKRRCWVTVVLYVSFGVLKAKAFWPSRDVPKKSVWLVESRKIERLLPERERWIASFSGWSEGEMGDLKEDTFQRSQSWNRSWGLEHSSELLNSQILAHLRD